MRFNKASPHTGFRQDSPVGKLEGAALEGSDDCVAHVTDEDGHGGYSDERPNDEEGFPCVGRGGEVSVADGQKGDVAEIERLKVAETLSMGLCFPETNGTNAPKKAD